MIISHPQLSIDDECIRKDALHIVSTDLWLKIILPGWLLRLGPTKRIRDFRVAYHDLEVSLSLGIHGVGRVC